MDPELALPPLEQSCVEILERLRGDPSPLAEAFSAEALELLGILQQWKKDVPPPADRVGTVMRVMETFRRALEYSTGASIKPPAE